MLVEEVLKFVSFFNERWNILVFHLFFKSTLKLPTGEIFQVKFMVDINVIIHQQSKSYITLVEHACPISHSSMVQILAETILIFNFSWKVPFVQKKPNKQTHTAYIHN